MHVRSSCRFSFVFDDHCLASTAIRLSVNAYFHSSSFLEDNRLWHSCKLDAMSPMLLTFLSLAGERESRRDLFSDALLCLFVTVLVC